MIDKNEKNFRIFMAVITVFVPLIAFTQVWNINKIMDIDKRLAKLEGTTPIAREWLKSRLDKIESEIKACERAIANIREPE